MTFRSDRPVRVNETAAEQVDRGGEPVRVVLREQLKELNAARTALAEVRYGYGIDTAIWTRARDSVEALQLVTRALLARSEQLLTHPPQRHLRRDV